MAAKRKSKPEPEPQPEPKPEPQVEQTILPFPQEENGNGNGDKLDADLAEAGEGLIKNSSKVRIRTSGFSTSAKVDAETAAEMLEGTDAERNTVSISKRFMVLKHPALKAFNEAKAAIGHHVDSMTIPLILLHNTNTAAGMRKDAGSRLVQKKDMQEFHERLEFLIGVLGTAAESLQKALPEIMEEEKETRGTLYRETDYPKDVTKMVKVHVSYEPVGVDPDWEKLCPKIYAREAAACREKFKLVVENAAVEFTTQFVGYVQQVVDQLSQRVRLNPVEGKGWDEYKDAEVVMLAEYEHDEDIPPGYVLPSVRLKSAKAGPKEIKKFPEPIKRTVYEDELRPFDAVERHKIYDSTLLNLKQQMERFLAIGDMLGPYKHVIHESVDRVKDMLVKASKEMKVADIAHELRTSKVFRAEMKEVLGEVATIVANSVSETVSTRRKVNDQAVDLD